MAFKNAGRPWAEIFSILKKSGCNASGRTIRRIWYNYQKCGSAQERQKSGRPHLCSERAERAVIRHVRANRRASLQEVAGTLNQDGLHLSRNTVARVLGKNGYKRRGVCSRPILNARQRANRLEWAQNYSEWKARHWSRVVFSDEKIFRCDSNRPGQRITRKKGERLSNLCVNRVSKSRPQIHAWGCFG